MRGRPDPGAVGAEFFDLWTAETADDFRRVLVLHPPMRRAGDLNPRAAAATVAGLLDAIGSLPPAAQEFLIGKAVRWPNHSVRRQGIGLVAERKGPVAAYPIAAADPNASIRAWAASLLEPPRLPKAKVIPEPKAPKEGPPVPAPPTLF